MKKKITKKYGFFMCISMIISTVIGTGIFFKNESIFGLTNGNGILGLISWTICGIIVLFFGLSFIEISSVKQNSNLGVSLYAKIFGGKIFGNIVRNYMNNIYIPLTTFIVAYYTTKSSIWAFGGGFLAEIYLNEKVGGHINYQLILISFSIFYTVLLIYISIYLEKVYKYIQITTVILKIFPLILIGLIGMFFLKNDYNSFSKIGLGDFNKYKLVANKNWFEIILIASPVILFSFDGFLSTTYIKKNIKNSERNIPLSLIIGLLLITIIYLFVSIGTLNLNVKGNIAISVSKIFNNYIFNKIFEKIIFFFILISAFGTLNGYSFLLIKINNSSIKDNFIFFSKFLNKIIKIYNINLVNFLLSFVIILIWGLIIGIITIFVKKNYNFYDFINNISVNITFLIYAIIIILGIFNRYHKRVKIIKNWFFIPSAIISVIFIITIIGYNLYLYFLNIILIKEKNEFILLILLLFIFILPSFCFLNKK